MAQQLAGQKIAILATHGFEESELTSPRQALEEVGAEVHVVSPETGGIRAWAKTDWGETYPVDRTLSEARESDYQALVLPGGLFNPDTLRLNEQALEFVRQFFASGKPVAAICHAPWILINADVVTGRKMTSVHSLAQDLRNAGADWQDQSVVCDKALVTSRTPADLEDFNAKLIEEIGEGRHAGQHV